MSVRPSGTPVHIPLKFKAQAERGHIRGDYRSPLTSWKYIMLFRKPEAQRLIQLAKLRATVFEQPFNPERVQRGTRVLDQKLRGEQMRKWYLPTNNFLGTAKQLTQQLFKDHPMRLVVKDPVQIQRLAHVENLKIRGKGTPAKKKEKKIVDKKKRK